jgi:hypothetical protein
MDNLILLIPAAQHAQAAMTLAHAGVQLMRQAAAQTQPVMAKLLAQT